MTTRPIQTDEGFSSKPISERGETDLTPEEKSLILRTQALAENLEGALPLNGEFIGDAQIKPADDLLAAKMTKAVAPLLFPNVSLFALQVGLKKEELYRQELFKASDEASQLQQGIEKLITLSGKLAIHAVDKDELVLSDEVKGLCKELKDMNIEILQPNEIRATRDRIAEVKSHISSHVDRLKTELQKKFTTEIQVKINELNSLLEVLKTIEKYLNRLLSTCVANQRKQ